MTKYRTILGVFFLFARLPFLWAQPAEPAKAQPKPNVILMLADDLGYGDLGCFGSQDIHTPNLDQLAQQGMRWTQFYAASAVCTPTRASIQTGRYPLRFGISNVFFDREEHLPKGAVLLPQLLQAAGYTTAHIGKWHLGGLNIKHTTDRERYPYGPLQMGYDYSLTMYEDPALRGVMYKGKRIYRDGAKYYVRNDTLALPSDKHMTEFETDDAIRVIEDLSRTGKPFFLNFCPFNPHLPYEPTPAQYMRLYEGKASGDQQLYQAMVTQLDACIGRIIAKVNALGLAENTLLIFTSDNGPAYYGSAGPYRGHKGDLYEGGLRVPAIMAWKGKIKAGATAIGLAHTVDLLPTICEAAGADLPQEIEFDGKSLLSYMLNNKSLPESRTLFWQMNFIQSAFGQGSKPTPFATEVVRDGNWKLLAMKGESVALYNLEKDPTEQKNVLESEKAIREKLMMKLSAWLEDCRSEKHFNEN